MTLIELIVVIAIFGILAAVVFSILNVTHQFDKAKDAQRRSDFVQIRSAAELYYTDHNYYPPSIAFGSPFTAGPTVYMAKTPQDPDCQSGSHPCYLYVTDQTTPSQPSWFVAYGKLALPPSGTPPCNLACIPPAPPGYDICVYGGNVDCSVIATITPIPSGSTSTSTPMPPAPPVSTFPSAPTPTPTVTVPLFPTPTPTPTPTPAAPGYSCVATVQKTGGTIYRCTFVGAGQGTYYTSSCNGACL